MPAPTPAFCREILCLDAGIRFAGVADRIGRLVAAEYRPDLKKKPLLTKEESELSAIQSILRMGTRATLEGKLGRVVYAFTQYEKVKRATIPLAGGSI